MHQESNIQNTNSKTSDANVTEILSPYRWLAVPVGVGAANGVVGLTGEAVGDAGVAAGFDGEESGEAEGSTEDGAVGSKVGVEGTDGSRGVMGTGGGQFKGSRHEQSEP